VQRAPAHRDNVGRVREGLETNASRVRRFVLWTLVGLIAAAGLIFCLDFMVFKVRAAAKWNAYGSVTVNHYYAVAQKSGKTQLIFDPPQAQTCIHALFPHAGMLPCWYLTKHPDQRTDL